MKKIPNKVGEVSLKFTACKSCHYNDSFNAEECSGKDNPDAPEDYFEYDAENNCITCCGFEPVKKSKGRK